MAARKWSAVISFVGEHVLRRQTGDECMSLGDVVDLARPRVTMKRTGLPSPSTAT